MKSNSVNRTLSRYVGNFCLRVSLGAGRLCGVRWDQLFAELESQYLQFAAAAEDAELSERIRLEQGAVVFVARLAGAIGRPVRLSVTAGRPVTGALHKVGPDWVLVGEAPGREALVSLSAVTVVEGLTAATGAPVTGVAQRLDLRFALRGLARDRSPVALTVPGGWGAAGTGETELTGTIDRVGADYIELALHAAWEPRRAAAVRQVVLLPRSAIVAIRPMPLG